MLVLVRSGVSRPRPGALNLLEPDSDVARIGSGTLHNSAEYTGAYDFERHKVTAFSTPKTSATQVVNQLLKMKQKKLRPSMLQESSKREKNGFGPKPGKPVFQGGTSMCHLYPFVFWVCEYTRLPRF